MLSISSAFDPVGRGGEDASNKVMDSTKKIPNHHITWTYISSRTTTAMGIYKDYVSIPESIPIVTCFKVNPLYTYILYFNL
jgi:hypothetical protein